MKVLKTEGSKLSAKKSFKNQTQCLGLSPSLVMCNKNNYNNNNYFSVGLFVM